MQGNEEDKHLELTIYDESTQELVNSTLDQAFSVEPSQMLTNSESLLSTLDEEQLGQAYEPIKLALESTWRYANAMNGIITGGINHMEVAELFNQAASGFENLGLDHARDLSIGMGTYCQAVVDLQQLNINQAIDRLRSVESYLTNAGKFSRKFKPFIDHLKPDMLFASVLPPLQALDFATARTLTEEASNAAENVANTYYSEGDPERAIFQGLAYYYRAFYKLFKSYNDLQKFEYDRIAQDIQIIEDSIKARDTLGVVKDISEPIRIVAYISEAMALLAEVIHELALVMKKVFESTIKPELVELREMRRKLRLAAEPAAKAGPQAITFVRFCEQIANQIKNLERLARPSKKDFGIYSGLISSATFVILLLVTSWFNTSLQLDLGTERLITVSLVLALIAGFGFGAVKFKKLLFLQEQGNGSSD